MTAPPDLNTEPVAAPFRTWRTASSGWVDEFLQKHSDICKPENQPSFAARTGGGSEVSATPDKGKTPGEVRTTGIALDGVIIRPGAVD
jgi:hypothetical protein